MNLQPSPHDLEQLAEQRLVRYRTESDLRAAVPVPRYRFALAALLRRVAARLEVRVVQPAPEA